MNEGLCCLKSLSAGGRIILFEDDNGSLVGIDALGDKFLFELVTDTGVHRCRPNELLVCFWLMGSLSGFLRSSGF